MPELPEVETVRRGLATRLPGTRLRQVEFARHDLRWPIPTRAVRALVGQRFASVRRRSKYLLLAFAGSEAPTLIVHLGMSGRLFVTRGREAPPWRPHEHWRMRCDNLWLRFVDPRRFGVLDVAAGAELGGHRLLRALGIEPLSAGFDAAWLFRSTRKRRSSIKSFLMDASLIAGIGNVYVAEACFRAGVRPGRAAGSLTHAECGQLARAVRAVLRAAIRAGGTTLRDYIGADENGGLFQRQLRVYGRSGEPCRRCGTKIRRAAAGGRSSYWCPTCQR